MHLSCENLAVYRHNQIRKTVQCTIQAFWHAYTYSRLAYDKYSLGNPNGKSVLSERENQVSRYPKKERFEGTLGYLVSNNALKDITQCRICKKLRSLRQSNNRSITEHKTIFLHICILDTIYCFYLMIYQLGRIHIVLKNMPRRRMKKQKSTVNISGTTECSTLAMLSARWFCILFLHLANR